MIDAAIESQLSAYLDKMPIEQQRRVLEFARTLASHRPRGVAGRMLLRFAGAIEEADLDLISEAIQAGCERIDANEW